MLLFSDLNLQPCLIEQLTKLGYEQPTEVQAQAIEPILQGQDVMARAQTGTGKTAAFALPILSQLIELTKNNANQMTADAIATPSALILAPTRELAQQVHKSFKRYSKGAPGNINTVCLYGGVSINPQTQQLKQPVDIIIATPGRLLDHLFKRNITLDGLQTLVFDEADRMLDMGFSDEIERILKRCPKHKQTLLFSATFDEPIFKLSKRLLNQPKLVQTDEQNTAAKSVEQIIYAIDKNKKREVLSYLIGSRNFQQVLVFARSKDTVDHLVKQMNLDGIETQGIHGDKSQGARERVLEQFKQGQIRALVATDVASRGLDIKQLPVVFNYELPHNSVDYIHRIGRTGRAGDNGLAISLLSHNEQPLLNAIEKLLDTHLVAQWLPGYEPDLDQVADSPRPDKRKGKGKRRRTNR